MPPYDENIPQATDLLSDSQGDMLDNFGEIATLFAVNHYPFGNAKEGKHKFCTFPQEVGAVAPRPTEVLLKANLNVITNQPELVYYNAGNPLASPSYMTYRSPFNPIIPGWAAIAGNRLQVKWGKFTVTGFGICAFDLQNNPFLTAVYSIILTPISTDNTDIMVRLVGYGTPQLFSVYCSQRSQPNVPVEVQFTYLAIGV